MQLGTVTLPDDLIWSDEYAWSPVSQAVDITLGGALMIQEAAQLKGRPITLVGADDRAWLTSAQIEDLRLLANTANATHSLTLPDARTFNVRFSRSGQPFKAKQLLVGDSDFWVLEELKLFEV